MRTALILALLVAPASAQVLRRVSVSSGGAQGTLSSRAASVSADGRLVAFQSDSPNLVAGDTNGWPDIFVHDRITQVTERVSLGLGGVQSNSLSDFPAISADGRFVAFYTFATNLVPGDTNAVPEIYVRDRQLGTTVRAGLDSGGAEGNGGSTEASISADGRFVAYHSPASNLVLGDANATYDVFVRDLQSGTTERVSVSSAGVEGNGESFAPAISGDGRYVAFYSLADNLVAGDANAVYDVFVRDRQAGTTERVSVSTGGAEADQRSYYPSISADGRQVAFDSEATNLVAGDLNGAADVFVRDLNFGTTSRLSVSSGGAEGNGISRGSSSSADGRYVAFWSYASNLVAGDTNGAEDVFVRDRLTGTTTRADLSTAGGQGNQGAMIPSISADGRFVAFESESDNLVGGDTNTWDDVFLRDRVASGFTSLCSPGLGGVIPCPCSNPPGGFNRGCNNSSGTGGASLTASGAAYLTADSLVFTTSGERPTALSIVAQWNGTSATGVVFGMGVRCTSGTLKRLYSRNAVGGSITAPNFGLGEPSVSTQSALKGDTILAGQSRWYLVYYRDNVVLGGCPPTSNFNATQTGQVTWSP